MLVPLTTGAALLSGGANLGDLALKTIESYATPAFYLGDQNPALRMPSGLRRGYQDFANTPVTASTQTAALALDLSEGSAIGAELISGDYTDYWSDVGNVDVQANQIVATGSTNEQFLDADLLTEGVFYLISFDITDPGVDSVRFRAGSQTANDALITSAGTYTYLLRADGTYFGWRTGTSAQTFTISNISVRPIAGNHFYQATSADEPTLNLTSGLYGYLGDGTSKHFKTGLNAASTATILIAVNFSAILDIAVGCSNASSERMRVQTDASGLLRFSLGTSQISVGSDIRATPGIAAVSVSGSSYNGIWKPIGGAISTYSGSFSGSIPTTVPFSVFADNDQGTPAQFLSGTLWRAIAQQSAWSLAEMTAVANQWDRQLAALAA